MVGVALVPVEGRDHMPLLDGVVSYLVHLGQDVDRDQLIAGLPVTDGVLSPTLLKRVAARVGYVVSHGHRKSLTAADLPCCAFMGNGRCVVLVDRNANGYAILHSDTQDTLGILDFEVFKEDFTGEFFKLHPSVDLLQSRYSPIEHERHWFWSRILSTNNHIPSIVASSLVANILAVVVSLFALQVYDRVIPSQSQATLWVLAAGVGIAILFEALLRGARAGLIDQVGKLTEIEISGDLFARLVNFPLDRLPMPPNAIAHTIREFSAIKTFFSTAAVGVVSDLPFVLIFFFVLYAIGGPIAFVVLCGGILMLLPSIFLRKRLGELSKESLGGTAASAQILNEAVYGLETLKVARKENFLQRQWEEIIALNAVRTTQQRKITAFLSFWSAAIMQVTYVCVIIASVYKLMLGDFTMGSIIAMSILSSRTLSPVSQLSGIILQWQNMRAALENLDILMNAEIERETKKNYLRRKRLKGHLSLRQVELVNEQNQIKRLDIQGFEVEPGSRVALVGGNGSGKTTVLNLLSGLHRPTRGEVLIDGVDIRQIDPLDLRANIGYLTQNMVMFRGTLRDNLQAPDRARNDEEIMEALEFAGVSGFVRTHPDGLDAPISDGGSGLSVGQKQCIGIARLYLQDPPIVLMDEPTSALDQSLEKQLVGKLGKWLHNRTTVIATHRSQIIDIMQHIAVIQNGRIAQAGPAQKLLENATKTKRVKPAVAGS